DLHRGRARRAVRRRPLRAGRRARSRQGARGRLRRRRAELANGKPLEDHDREPVRFRLRHRLDAQGPRHRVGGGKRPRARAPRHPAGRRLLRRSPDKWRQPARYQRANPPPAGGGGVRGLQVLPGTGRRTTRRVVEGHPRRDPAFEAGKLRTCRSTMLRMVPLPRWGRIVAAALLALPAPAFADTLIDNVNGITVDRNGTVTRFEAILIDDEGKVVELVSEGERSPRADYRENGRGRTVIPGIIDAHTHVMGLGLGLLTVDLSDTRTLAEAQARIAEYAAANPERPWIVGRGWNQEAWGLGRFPTAAELDAAVADRPVWLERIDGHAGWTNSAALNVAGVTAATADPAGGRIERLPGGREPSGVFVDAAMDLVASKVPPPRATDRDVALHEAQELLVRNGVTAVADMGSSIEDWMTFRRAGDEGRLRVRIMAYAASVPEMTLIGGTGPTQWLYDDRLRL